MAHLYEDRINKFFFSVDKSKTTYTVTSSKLEWLDEGGCEVSELLSAWGYTSYKAAYTALDAARRMLANGANKNDVIQYINPRTVTPMPCLNL